MTCSRMRDPNEPIDPAKICVVYVFTEDDAAKARELYPDAKITILPPFELGPAFEPMNFTEIDTGELLQKMIDHPERYRPLAESLEEKLRKRGLY